jgi:5'-3' exonuclease
MPAGDREFVKKLVGSLGLGYTLEVGDDCTMMEIFWAEGDDESDEESLDARERILKKYDNAETTVVKTAEELKVEKKSKFDEGFLSWKKDYYRVHAFLI